MLSSTSWSVVVAGSPSISVMTSAGRGEDGKAGRSQTVRWPCLPLSPPPPCRALSADPSRSRSTCPTGCPASPSSGSPMHQSEKREIVSVPRCCPAASPGPCVGRSVNLAPSGLRKGGAGLDLPIAVGLLLATGELSPDPDRGYGLLRRTRAQRVVAPRPGDDRPGRRHLRLGARRAAVRRGRGDAGRGPTSTAWPRWPTLAEVLRGQARGPSARRRWPSRRGPRCRTSPTCGGRHSGAGPSRWRRRGTTTC